MARPPRCRRICAFPAYWNFLPEDGGPSPPVVLSLDEYEMIRLADYENLTHQQCAARMDISRTTATEIYESARHKIADSIVNGRPLLIRGGHYRLCDRQNGPCCGSSCHAIPGCTDALPDAFSKKGATVMRIAVTYENGNIFPHFGHTEQFKIYDVDNNTITHQEVVDTNGQGHGALAGFLHHLQTDALICGGIGGGAQAALNEAGVRLYAGVSGSADEAVRSLLDGSLAFVENANCSHHDHENHSCESHGREGHGCGGHSCH